ncbi:hypothetical protein MJG53_017603, partial [Ovis ammon polii x Ovis aries]
WRSRTGPVSLQGDPKQAPWSSSQSYSSRKTLFLSLCPPFPTQPQIHLHFTEDLAANHRAVPFKLQICLSSLDSSLLLHGCFGGVRSPTPISSLEQNERAGVEASQVVRLQTMSKREGGELSLHERSWNAHGLGPALDDPEEMWCLLLVPLPKGFAGGSTTGRAPDG